MASAKQKQSKQFPELKRILFMVKVFVLLLGLASLKSCADKSNEKVEQEHPNITKLKKQSAEFIPEIIKMNEHVYAAVGYDGSNASMVIGEQGVVIIDALRALGAAEIVAEEFRKICDKPVKALIYTHGHGDHTGGTMAFVGNNKDVKIIARKGFKEDLQDQSPVEPILKQRNARQFGRNLPDDVIINRGVAPGRTSTDRVGKGYIKPNILFQDSLFISLAGIDFELYAADGETNDQLFVWCPAEKALFAGDNYYRAFPNLYAIRGSKYRDVNAWGQTVHKMSSFPVESLVPGHTRPLSGTKLIHNNLRNYSAAILSVYEQTIACMNKGYTLQETVDAVKLPESLINQANLQEFYGSVPWGVRSIFFHYVGWFDGNPTNLYPLSTKKEAEQIIELAGGQAKLFVQLDKAVQNGDFQWSLQLADYLLQTDYNADKVTGLKIKALRGLAKQQINAPARNYYLSYAYELEE